MNAMLHGHGNIEMNRHVDTWDILKNMHDTCPTHVSDTFRTRHGFIIEMSVLDRINVQHIILKIVS